ncbi:MAG: ATP-dependent RNA helicase RhlB [Thermodesulfobacteriota bacterium]
MGDTSKSAQAKKSPRKRRRRRKPGKRVKTDQMRLADKMIKLHEGWDETLFEVPPAEGQIRFHDFELPSPLMHAIADLGFQYCTPIQAEILPSTLTGRDATGRAQTGTGKTAAFLITIITRLLANPLQKKRKQASPRVLILAPTRELVMQISEEAKELSKYTSLNIVSVFGGMDYVKQRTQLARGAVDMIVATPGRLLDFKRRGDLTLKEVEILIIDEADRMLDMGFIPDVRNIIYSTPHKDKRQTMLFSATLTDDIIRLATQWTRRPVTVEIEPNQVAVDSVEQIVYIVTTEEKFSLLFNIIDKQNLERVLVFCNRRDEVRRLSEKLTRYGIRCSTLSGDVPQKKRVQRLEQFKGRKIRVLVATDVAGRGIHIEGMDHVINYTLPRDPEDYVHRIGRTGRAGETGTSISFADEEDAFYLPPIEEFIDQELGCIRPDESWLTRPTPVKTKKTNRKPPRSRNRRSSPRRQNRSPKKSY